jgi:uncharacterized protein (DUF2062 family)
VTDAPNVCILIPVYNHAGTLRRIAERALAVHPYVLVVDDGSTDGGAGTLGDLPVTAVKHERNLGKGAAILTGAALARKRGFTHIVTLDADGQHDPEDFGRFLPVLQEDPTAIVVGARDFTVPNVPASSRFGRSFSNFWLRVQTGKALSDVQSGFRAYPLAVFDHLAIGSRRYDFEVEVLVRAAWAGFALREVPISVHYPPGSERISHFKALADNVRISILNTRLTARAMMPLPQRGIATNGDGNITPVHPVRSLRILMAKRQTPAKLAFSGAFGVFVGALPLPGLSCMLILLTSGVTSLNKHAALAANQLCIPPFVQALCVLAGYRMRHGHWLAEYNVQTLGYEAWQRLYEWVLGSLVVAPLLAVIVGGFVYALALGIRLGLGEDA